MTNSTPNPPVLPTPPAMRRYSLVIHVKHTDGRVYKLPCAPVMAFDMGHALLACSAYLQRMPDVQPVGVEIQEDADIDVYERKDPL